MNDVTLEGAQELRSFLLAAGRTMTGEGVDRLRQAVHAMSVSSERELQPVGRYWSSAMGAALQLIREPEADPRPLAVAAYRYYSLGLDAWFLVQERALGTAGRDPPTDMISLRASAPASRDRPKPRDPMIDMLAELCRAGSRAARGDAAGPEDMNTAALAIRAALEKGISP